MKKIKKVLKRWWDNGDIMTILVVLIIASFAIAMEFLIPSSPVVNKEPPHECIYFEKKSTRRMITPMTYRYEDALFCIECGREYKN